MCLKIFEKNQLIYIKLCYQKSTKNNQNEFIVINFMRLILNAVSTC